MPKKVVAPQNDDSGPRLACVVSRRDNPNYRAHALADAENTTACLVVTSTRDSALMALAMRCDTILVYVDEGVDEFMRDVIKACDRATGDAVLVCLSDRSNRLYLSALEEDDRTSS